MSIEPFAGSASRCGLTCLRPPHRPEADRVAADRRAADPDPLRHTARRSGRRAVMERCRALTEGGRDDVGSTGCALRPMSRVRRETRPPRQNRANGRCGPPSRRRPGRSPRKGQQPPSAVRDVRGPSVDNGLGSPPACGSSSAESRNWPRAPARCSTLRLLGLLALEHARGRLRRLWRRRDRHGPERQPLQRGPPRWSTTASRAARAAIRSPTRPVRVHQRRCYSARGVPGAALRARGGDGGPPQLAPRLPRSVHEVGLSRQRQRRQRRRLGLLPLARPGHHHGRIGNALGGDVLRKAFAGRTWSTHFVR